MIKQYKHEQLNKYVHLYKRLQVTICLLSFSKVFPYLSQIVIKIPLFKVIISLTLDSDKRM